jgi:hypothetical protein
VKYFLLWMCVGGFSSKALEPSDPLYTWGRIECRPELFKFQPIRSLDSFKSSPRALY